LDSAAFRRFEKTIYVGLPDAPARVAILKSILDRRLHEISEEEIVKFGEDTPDYSGADILAYCHFILSLIAWHCFSFLCLKEVML